MHKLLKTLAVLLLFYALLVGCGVRLSNTSPVFEETVPPRVEKLESFLSLPVSIPFAVIEKEINNQLTDLIYEDICFDTPDENNLMLKVWKTRDIAIQGRNEFLRTDVPLRIWANYRWRACDFCPAITRETSFEILVTLTSQVSVTRDWRLEVKTISSDFQFESRPRLDFGPVRIPITAIVEPIVRREIEAAIEDIDKEIAESIDFSSEIEAVWHELHKPQLIDPTHGAWLKIVPLEVLVSPIRTQNQNVRFTVAFRGVIEILFEEKPTPCQLRPLPLLGTLDTPNQDFNIFVESFIGFDAATAIARRHLKDSIFQITALRSVKIDDIRLMGVGSRVYARLDLSRSVKGTVYFRGIPAYNDVEQIIYLKNFDYDIATRNVLLNSANWLMYEAFRKRIEESFRYSLKNDLTEVRTVVGELLSDFEFENLFSLRGRLRDIDIYNIIVEPHGLRVIIKAQGQTRMLINDFHFQ